MIKERSSSSSEIQRRRILCGGIRSLGAIVFPLLLFKLLPEDKKMCNASIPPLLWMSIATLVDEYLLFYSKSAETNKPASIRLDPNCLAGLAFGISGFVGVRENNELSPLFLTAVVVCLAIVLPSHNLEQGSFEEQVMESVQKTVLLSCISLVMAGVSFAREAKTK